MRCTCGNQLTIVTFKTITESSRVSREQFNCFRCGKSYKIRQQLNGKCRGNELKPTKQKCKKDLGIN